MENGLSPRIGKSTLVILTITVLAITVLILSGLANATYYVKSGHSIQSVIDAANPGQIVEVQNGTFHERVNMTKELTLKGMGKPVIDAGGKGSAVTISANGSTLMGFSVTGSGSDAKDAGIRVLSDGNIIKNNTVVKNGNYGIILYYADKNAVFSNTVTENKNGGFLLIHSNNNQIWGNYAGMNWNGITIETSRGNNIMSNNLTRNKMGINISNINLSESVTTKGKGVTIAYVSGSQAKTYNIGQNSTNASKAGANVLYLNNLLNNVQNAFDDGYNQWDNGKAGNHYSNYDAREQGCLDRNRDGICDSGYGILGGHNVDNLPKASIDAILSYRAKGLMGSVLKLDHRTYMPGGDVNAFYVAPGNFSGWMGIMKTDQTRGKASRDKALSSQNLEGSSGILKLKAPAENGSYDLRLYDTNGVEMDSLNFNVMVPTVTATPASVNTCEEITVSYAGAPGYENDWIAMYKSGSPDTSFTSRQYLDGNENGTVILDAPDPGMYDFRIFENDSYTRLATSSSIEVKIFKGNKVIASPSHVAPGGKVTVSYWGAPPEGTAVIGMYGVNRPDKFPVETRSIGSNNCGRITWRLPADPGTYDFRMFRSAITDVGQGAYQLLGQSNVVTVG
jgi:parallel beta-helix repeat protein